MRGNEPLACQRDAFSLPSDLHYLNCAYLGPLPRVSQEAGVAAVARKANPATIRPEDFFAESNVVRQLFAELINARDPNRVALIPAVSYGAATVARNTPVAQGQNIVVVGEDFPSDMYTWRRVARQSGAALRVVSPPTGEGLGGNWNSRVLDSIDRNTAVVSLPHVHWADGTKFDLVTIGRSAREAGAALVVDGTQSVGALPFDVEEIQPDALICAGYKWLLGPYSTGLAYFGPRYDHGEPIEENWITRKGSDDFQRLVDYEDEYAPGAIRYDAGERSNFILLPMLIAALRLILSLKPARIQEYCRRLTEAPLERARELGFAIEDSRWRGAHLFGVRAPAHVDLAQLSQALQGRKIAVSLRGSALRVSPNVYNDEDDLNMLVQVFEEQSQ
ncbi:MAG: aminotransferase class V-fold PLP-dependent enzyme [Vicinamibacterales bacterium]|nr:aminotransferase class V-fold PLP-dependent enzyme [Vicinamibacterales bacterium]